MRLLEREGRFHVEHLRPNQHHTLASSPGSARKADLSNLTITMGKSPRTRNQGRWQGKTAISRSTPDDYIRFLLASHNLPASSPGSSTLRSTSQPPPPGGASPPNTSQQASGSANRPTVDASNASTLTPRLDTTSARTVSCAGSSSTRHAATVTRSRPKTRAASLRNAAFRCLASTSINRLPASARCIGIAGDPAPEPTSITLGALPSSSSAATTPSSSNRSTAVFSSRTAVRFIRAFHRKSSDRYASSLPASSGVTDTPIASARRSMALLRTNSTDLSPPPRSPHPTA